MTLELVHLPNDVATLKQLLIEQREQHQATLDEVERRLHAEYKAALDAILRRLTTNASERALKRVAIDRKNWLFAVNDRAGQTAARLWSLLASAEHHGLDPQAYLTSLFAKFRCLSRAAQRPAKRNSPSSCPTFGKRTRSPNRSRQPSNLASRAPAQPQNADLWFAERTQ